MDEGILRVFQEHKEKLYLKTEIIGKPIVHFHRLNSTNDKAFNLALNNAKEGTCIITDIQTKGKGRMGRTWHSPAGGLYFSFILRPEIAPNKINLITLVFAVAIAKSLRKFGLNAKIKWPNDILIAQRKICGILLEMDCEADRIKFLIAGIGINNSTSHSELTHNATSVYEETGMKINNQDLLKETLENLDKYYLLFKKGQTKRIIQEAKQLSMLINKKVNLTIAKKTIAGKVVCFNTDCAIILKTKNSNTERFLSADNLRVQN